MGSATSSAEPLPDMDELPLLLDEYATSIGCRSGETVLPTGKLRRAVAAAAASGDQRPMAVLVTTGAMNPPHEGHLQVLDAAAAGLEARGVNVLASFLSPSHDKYVWSKLQAEYIPATHRIAMAKLLTAEHATADVAGWEAAQEGFVDFPNVRREIGKALLPVIQQVWADAVHDGVEEAGDAAEGEKSGDGEEAEDTVLPALPTVKFMYACGADLAYRCGLETGRIADVIAVGRAGVEGGEELSSMFAEGKTDDRGRFTYVVSKDERLASLSSTAVRKAVACGGALHDLLPKALVDYLTAHDCCGVAGWTLARALLRSDRRETKCEE